MRDEFVLVYTEIVFKTLPNAFLYMHGAIPHLPDIEVTASIKVLVVILFSVLRSSPAFDY